jgi:hypothetical protein
LRRSRPVFNKAIAIMAFAFPRGLLFTALVQMLDSVKQT